MSTLTLLWTSSCSLQVSNCPGSMLPASLENIFRVVQFQICRLWPLSYPISGLYVQPWPNGCNMLVQHLRAFGHYVAQCCVRSANPAQHVVAVSNNVACMLNMLHPFGLGLRQYDPLSTCDPRSRFTCKFIWKMDVLGRPRS